MHPIICLGLFLTLILGLPLSGLLLSGYSLPNHLTLFPIPTKAGIESFSWLVCELLAALAGLTLIPVVYQLFQKPDYTEPISSQTASFPWWGWVAILWTTGTWVLTWTRFSWFEAWQPHTFPLLWFGYIVILNGLTYQRSHQCLFLDRPRFLYQLFFLSAVFWWTFEYLNQFVNNWHYVDLPKTSHFEYVFYTSLAFSTVLPAVVSTNEWLTTFSRLTRPYENWYSLSWVTSQETGWILLTLGSLGLGLIGIWPTLLFPLLWLCPLCLILGLQLTRKKKTYFHSLAHGDWRPVILSALATLFCSFWWECWNVYSLVHWEYTIPYVHAFKLYEMPILGYSGYIPFGLTCLAITEYALRYNPSGQLKSGNSSNNVTT